MSIMQFALQSCRVPVQPGQRAGGDHVAREGADEKVPSRGGQTVPPRRSAQAGQLRGRRGTVAGQPQVLGPAGGRLCWICAH